MVFTFYSSYLLQVGLQALYSVLESVWAELYLNGVMNELSLNELSNRLTVRSVIMCYILCVLFVVGSQEIKLSVTCSAVFYLGYFKSAHHTVYLWHCMEE